MRRLILLLVGIVISVMSYGSGASAQTVNDFIIQRFDGRYELFNDVPGGRLDVTETIELTYSAQNHGILRALPKSYQDQDLRLRVIGVQRNDKAEAYTTYEDSGNTVLKIGNPDATITDSHTYVIRYEMRNVIRFFDGHAEWYWDINGDQWQQPFQRVSGEVMFPSDWNPDGLPAPRCFTGVFGTLDTSCTIERTARGYRFSVTRPLGERETLTVVTAAQRSLFQERTWVDWLKDHWFIIAGTVLPPLLIGTWAYRRWVKSGKDLKGRGTIIPEYGPPKNLSAAEAAVVMNYSLQTKDVSATIIDLAIRRYIRINEITKKKILKDKQTYEFELLNTEWTQLKSHESEILTNMFKTKAVGTKIELESLKDEFYKTITSLQSSIPIKMTSEGYFVSNPKRAGWSMYALALVLGIIGFILLPIVPGLLISALIVGVFAALMSKRTAEGVKVKEAMQGLKLYMDVAEKDRIAMLQSPDARYAKLSAEPQKTVELFEKLLPFAIVLGVEKGWAEQFKDIYTQPPDWYGGNWGAFNTGVLVGSLNSSVSAMGTNFSPPSSSSGSGFSGGGSSGGGGGGGGGGGW